MVHEGLPFVVGRTGREFRPMSYTSCHCAGHGASTTMRLAHSPPHELSSTLVLTRSFTSKLFTELYIPFVEFDLSDPTLNWETLVLPWQHIWKDLSRVLVAFVGIENAHPFAMAELAQLVANWKVIIEIETANGNAPINDSNQEALVNRSLLPPSHQPTGKHQHYFFDIEDVVPYNYILVSSPPISSPFHPRGREFLSRAQALDFVDELFEAGRYLRCKKPKSCKSVRRMIYAWAVSLNFDIGSSGVLATYAIGGFGSGEYDAWDVWDRTRVVYSPNDQPFARMTMDPTSVVCARWKERHQVHKTQSHDFDVLALVQTWKIKNCFPAWHLLPMEHRYAMVHGALESQFVGHNIINMVS